jgi:hypothetical protein
MRRVIDLQLDSSFRRLAIITLMLITLSTTLLAYTKASLEDGNDAKIKTEDLLSLFQEAQNNVAEIFDKFETATQKVPQESLDHYNYAILLAEDSRNLLENGRYSDANNKVIQALQELKEALQILYITSPSVPQTDLEKAAELKNSLYRYDEQIQRIENLSSLLAAHGFDTMELEADISRIKLLFDEAIANIEQMHFDAAAFNIAEVEGLFNKLLILVNEFAADLNIERLQTYINQSETRLDSIREEAELQLNTASLAALDEAQTSLDAAKDFLQNQQLNETLSELVSSKESEEDALEYLQPNASSFEDTSSVVEAVKAP